MSNTKKKSPFWLALENFWYYNKWKVVIAIALILGIFAAISLSSGMSDDDKPRDLSVVCVFSRPLSTENYNFSDKFSDCITDIDKNGEKHIGNDSFYITESGKGQNDEIAIAQFENALAFSKGDLILFDKSNLDRFISKDFFEPIEKYVSLTGIPEENIVSRNGVPVAVRLSDSKALLEMGFVIDNVYASVMYIPEEADDIIISQRENTKGVIKKLLEK